MSVQTQVAMHVLPRLRGPRQRAEPRDISQASVGEAEPQQGGSVLLWHACKTDLDGLPLKANPLPLFSIHVYLRLAIKSSFFSVYLSRSLYPERMNQLKRRRGQAQHKTREEL